MSKRTIGFLAGGLMVLVLVVMSFSLSQVLATRLSPTTPPTRTPRPTWTPASAGFIMASPTLDATHAAALATASVPLVAQTPQLVVPGQSQGLVVPQPNGAPGQVLTVVVVIVTATPPPGAVGAPLPGVLGGLPVASRPVQEPTKVPAGPTNTPVPPVVVHVVQPKAYVRQGPGVTYAPVTQLDKDTTVTVVGRNRAGDWWKICCVNGSDVWIADLSVKVEGPLWTVPEVVNIPPSPAPSATRPPPPTVGPTPTFAWPLRVEGTPQLYRLGQNYFSISAVIYDGSTPYYGYKLRIRKLSTGQEWLTNGSDAFWSFEPLEWGQNAQTPTVNLKRNLKWDSNGIQVPLGDDTWEVTCTDGAGTPVSAPVRFNTSATNSKWYYIVFTSRR